MKVFGLAAALVCALATAVPANAGSLTCQTLGNRTTCSDGSSVTRIGKFSNDEKGNRWQQVGKFTYGSDGSTYNRIGTMTYDNEGNHWNRVGNHTYGSDGSSCMTIGNQVHCGGGRGDDPGAAAKLVKPGLIGTE